METLIEIMTNPGLYLIRDQICNHLSHDNMEPFRDQKVFPDLWNESLERISLLKYINEFGNRNVRNWRGPVTKIQAVHVGWNEAVKKTAIKSSLEDLKEIKKSLTELLRKDVDDNLVCHLEQFHMHIAAHNGFLKLMELLLGTSFHWNSDDFGQTVFHSCCSSGSTELVQLMMRSSNDALDSVDNMGRGAFHFACQSGSKELVQFLIESSKSYGIDLNKDDYNGQTAFHYACRSGSTEVVQLMASLSNEHEIDLNKSDNNGRTALYIVCHSGREKPELAKWIFENHKEFGIDIKHRDKSGRNALDYVRQLRQLSNDNRWKEVKSMLKKEYAKIDKS